MVKSVYDKPVANTILSGGKLETFALESRKRHRCSLSYSCSTWHLNSKSHTRQKERRGRQGRKEKVKLSSFADEIILYLKGSKAVVLSLPNAAIF